MRIRQHLAHQPSGLAGIDEVIDDQESLAGAAAEPGGVGRDAFQDLQIALLGVVVAGNADGIDGAQAQFARNDRGGHQATAGNRDDGMKRADLIQPPGQCAAIPVKLVPRHRKGLACPLLGAEFGAFLDHVSTRSNQSTGATTGLQLLTRFLHANRYPLRSKTLYRFTCNPASISFTAVIAAASFPASRERTTRLVFGLLSSSMNG